MTKKEFIEKVRTIKDPRIIERDKWDMSHGAYYKAVWWTVYPATGSNMHINFTTPLVGINDVDSCNPEKLKKFNERVDQARKKYQRWFDEAIAIRPIPELEVKGE